QRESHEQRTAAAEGVDCAANHQRLQRLREVLEHQAEAADGHPAAVAPEIFTDGGERSPHGQIPTADATVLEHSMKTVFSPSRDFHQESIWKCRSGAATTRIAGPPPSARSVAR